MSLPRAALLPATLSLVAASTLVTASLAVSGVAAATPAFTIPAAPSAFARNVPVYTSSTFFKGGAALDATGTAHFAWLEHSASAHSDFIVTCTLPRGANACSNQSFLVPEQAQDFTLGAPQVVVDSPDNIEVIATECCETLPQGPTAVHWTSADNGATWGLAQEIFNASAVDDVTVDEGQLVAVGVESNGTVAEQVRNTTSVDNSPFTVGQSDDPTIGAKVGYDQNGGVLVAWNDKGTTNVTYQPDTGGTFFGAAPAGGASFAGETLESLASGVGGPWLMTRENAAGLLDPPVLLRHWNGSSFDAPVTLPVPGQGDDSHFHLVLDAAGRLHAFWTGARENYRLWHEVSANGGRTWTATLLDANLTAPGVYPVLDAQGIGVALEIPAGPGQVIVQPLLVTPTFSLKAQRTVKAGVTKAVVVSGTVGSPSPAKKIGSVSIQKLIGKHWTTVATQKLTGSGGFKVSLKPGKPGSSAQYRASTNGIAGFYDIGTSSPVTVKIPKV